MAEKPWLRKEYTLIIVPHAEAKFRKIKLPYWLMISISVVTAILLTLTITFLVHYIMMLNDVGRVNQLVDENQRLKKETAEYENQTSILQSRIEKVESKTQVLSVMAGVQMVESDGIGDINFPKFDNEILDRDLPLMSFKLDELSSTLSKVEKTFIENKEALDFTPSVWPLISSSIGRITSKYGYRRDPFTGLRAMHPALDISAPRGTPIIAPANGTVRRAEFLGRIGNMIEIDHGLGYITKYGHLSKFNVRAGQKVVRGDIIGYVGSTGRSTAPHVHYEVHYNGKEINPTNFILNVEDVPVFDYSVINAKN